MSAVTMLTDRPTTARPNAYGRPILEGFKKKPFDLRAV